MRTWTAALAIVVPFALQPTASNAQSGLGSPGSVKPAATGSIGGAVSAGNGTHPKRMANSGAGDGLRPSSGLRIDTVTKGRGAVVIDAAKGAFKFSTGAQGKSDVKIKTPQGTLGLRGG
jgi:hypothetical protein